MALNFRPIAFPSKPPESLPVKPEHSDSGGDKRFYPDNGPPPHAGIWTVKDTLIDYGAGLRRSYERATNFARRNCPPEAAICQGMAGLVGLMGGGVTEAGSSVMEGTRVFQEAQSAEDKVNAAAAVIGGLSSIALTVLAPASGEESLPARGSGTRGALVDFRPSTRSGRTEISKAYGRAHKFEPVPVGRTLAQLPGRSLQPVRLPSTMEGAQALKPVPRIDSTTTPSALVALPALEGFPGATHLPLKLEGYVDNSLPADFMQMRSQDEESDIRLHPQIETLSASVHAVRVVSDTLMSEIAESLHLQDMLQRFHEVRAELTPSDWAYLSNHARTPLEQHFVRFVRTSPGFSPEHWRNFLLTNEGRPLNRVEQSPIGECKILGVGNFVFAHPIEGLIPGTPLGIRYTGDSLIVVTLAGDRLTVNGSALKEATEYVVKPGDTFQLDGKNIHLGIRQVASETPETVWPNYQNTSDDVHPHAFSNYRLNPEDSAKYIVVRLTIGEYALRIGGKHHVDMMNGSDIFVAGGWLSLDAEGKIIIDGNTKRFGHLMGDQHFMARITIASRLFNALGFHVAHTTAPSARIGNWM